MHNIAACTAAAGVLTPPACHSSPTLPTSATGPSNSYVLHRHRHRVCLAHIHQGRLVKIHIDSHIAGMNIQMLLCERPCNTRTVQRNVYLCGVPGLLHRHTEISPTHVASGPTATRRHHAQHTVQLTTPTDNAQKRINAGCQFTDTR